MIVHVLSIAGDARALIPHAWACLRTYVHINDALCRIREHVVTMRLHHRRRGETRLTSEQLTDGFPISRTESPLSSPLLHSWCARSTRSRCEHHLTRPHQGLSPPNAVKLPWPWSGLRVVPGPNDVECSRRLPVYQAPTPHLFTPTQSSPSPRPDPTCRSPQL